MEEIPLYICNDTGTTLNQLKNGLLNTTIKSYLLLVQPLKHQSRINNSVCFQEAVTT